MIRFFDEFLRGDEIRGFVGALSTSQFISLFIVAVGILFWVQPPFFKKVLDFIKKPEEKKTA